MQRETGVVYGYTENSSKSSQRNPKRTEAGAGATSRNSTSVPVVVVYKYSPISHVPKSRDYARRKNKSDKMTENFRKSAASSER